MSAVDDKSLALQASRGDRVAIDRLIERHLPGLRAYLRLRAGDLLLAQESSADLAQSVCREILENLDRFQYDGREGFRRWLYRTAQRKIADRYEYYRAQKRDVRRRRDASLDCEILETYSSFYTPSRQAAAREELERVERAFAELPEEQREVILLAKIVGLSRREIGEEMGRSEGAVRVLLSRGLANLAAKLAP